ncbi:DNA repair ATPase-related protein [Prunus dulcis]|uniref:DNA repair ATPase-related protein n=1 Tax=Prunus dulcis TaxID=3755 RepID=A0A4Y1QU78_PRUDU|nr:DNA repair ATPase-related protein [Prunus dulcis]
MKSRLTESIRYFPNSFGGQSATYPTDPIRADVSVQGEEDAPLKPVRSDGPDSSALKIELDQLKSKIHTLVFDVDAKIKELKKKNEIIEQKEKIIQENSNSISSLQSEIESLQKKGSLDAEKQVGKAHARAGELEKKVAELKKELESQYKEKEALEARAKNAETKIDVLILKIENIEKISDDQKTKIRKTERALKVAEEEMLKAKFEATSKAKELKEVVHGAWLPPWLAVHLIHCQSLVETHWNEHGKPAVDIAVQKALEKKAQAEKWAEPHVETFKTKWIPAIKEQWLVVKESVEPHVKSLSKKTVEVYETKQKSSASHMLIKWATVAKPHVDKVRVVLKPYTKKAVHAYEKFLKSASTYHHQVQAKVKDLLKRHELTRALATKELEWFAASALLALPIIFLFRIFSSLFCTKSKKPVRSWFVLVARAFRGDIFVNRMQPRRV